MRVYAVIVLILISSTFSNGQKTIEELGELPARKFFKDVYFDTSLGNDLVKLLNRDRIKLEDLPELKRVGLASIFIKDDAFRKGRRGGVTYNHNQEENELAAGILNASMNSLKEVLNKLNITLLGSEDYLDDDEKKRLYKNFVFNYTGIPEAKKFGEFFERNKESPGSPAGYKPIFSTYEGGTSKSIVNGLGALSDELGLDALITLEIQTQTTNKSVVLESITVVMHGPHPTLKDEGLFMGIGQYSPSKQLAFAEVSGDNIKQGRYIGFGSILTRLVTGLAEVAIEEIVSIE